MTAETLPKTSDDSEIQAILSEYGHQSFLDRARVSKRLQWCQYDKILAALPETGTVLDIGCGLGHFGVYIWRHRPVLKYVGCDPDGAKISEAMKLACVQHGTCRFVKGTNDQKLEIPAVVDAVTVLDVLYLLPPELQETVLTDAANRIAPKGRIVIKSIDPTDETYGVRIILQEWVMVRLFRATVSSGRIAAYQSPDTYRALLCDVGFDVEIVPLPELRPNGNLIIGTKKENIL